MHENNNIKGSQRSISLLDRWAFINLGSLGCRKTVMFFKLLLHDLNKCLFAVVLANDGLAGPPLQKTFGAWNKWWTNRIGVHVHGQHCLRVGSDFRQQTLLWCDIVLRKFTMVVRFPRHTEGKKTKKKHCRSNNSTNGSNWWATLGCYIVDFTG